MKILEFQSLSDTDIQAILTALPLVFDPVFDSSDEQTDINYLSCDSLKRKLLNRESSATYKELSLLCCAVLAAKEYLSGRLPLSFDKAYQAELSRYFFAYNKLAPACERTISYLEETAFRP